MAPLSITPQGRKLNRLAVKEEHQRKTQPNFEARQRQEERREAHERWRKDLEVGASGRGCFGLVGRCRGSGLRVDHNHRRSPDTTHMHTHAIM